MSPPPRQGRPAPCPVPGCFHIVPCPVHIKVPWAGSSRQAHLPPQWPKLRKRILRRDGYRCTWVEEGQRCPARATEVDHIERGDDHNEDNLRSLCHPHHAHKSGQEGAGVRNRIPRD